MPVVDKVAAKYQNDVTFLAVAGKGHVTKAAAAADTLFSDNLKWGYDDSIWDLYGVPGQPATILISRGVIVDMWFGETSAAFLNERIDNLLTL
ncbi:MAG: TlpA family protein disulfide reductase [Acidimicrobiia bacterium]